MNKTKMKRIIKTVLMVPARDSAGMTESGKLAIKAEGVKFLRVENGTAVYAVGSGTYQFNSIFTQNH